MLGLYKCWGNVMCWARVKFRVCDNCWARVICLACVKGPARVLLLGSC